MGTRDGGLVAVAYSPNQVHFKVNDSDVSITETTSYPFRGDIKLTLHLVKKSRFPLVLRIPDWATSAVVKINGKSAAAATDETAASGFFPISRDWRDGDVVTLTLPVAPRVTHWYHNSAAFEAGPLVFSLPLDGQWKSLKKYAEKSADWEVDASRPWNYAVQVGQCDARLEEHAIPEVPFDAKHPAVSIEVRGRQLPEWTVKENSAGPLPISPVSSEKPLKALTLVPYGAAKVRVTAFPYLDQPSRCQVASQARL
jgi:hypothetical protein